MLHELRQPRYLAFSVLMVVIAGICVALGTWQVQRFAEKRSENHHLRIDAHAAAEPVASVLSPVGEDGAAGRSSAEQYHTVTATGTYVPAGQLFVRGRTVDGSVAYLVLTPLRTDGPALLVVRGYVPADNNTTPSVAAPPSGRVTVQGRVQPADTGDDQYGRAPTGQVREINPARAADRLGTPVYDGYVELLGGQPGTAGVTAMPAPDLSNPAGGAIEPQHLAYIAQWYLFALLALAAPPVMARAESRRDDGPEQPPQPGDPTRLEDAAPQLSDAERAHRARMLDRYGSARRT